MISLSTGVALSIKMAQEAAKFYNGHIPLDADFFEPLNSLYLSVPVASDLELHIWKYNGNFYELYDFYLFTVLFFSYFYWIILEKKR